MAHKMYDCGICECWHPATWNGDCRDDANRYGGPEDYAVKHGISVFDVELVSMEDLEGKAASEEWS